MSNLPYDFFLLKLFLILLGTSVQHGLTNSRRIRHVWKYFTIDQVASHSMAIMVEMDVSS